MYSIGQFSMMLNLNKKTLRYYDDIDLFKPSYVDLNNQYRYYDETQISVIKEIMRLKNIGIPLEQIKKVLYEQNSEQLKETYFSRLEEIEILLKQLKMQKDLIRTRLKEDKTTAGSASEYSIERGYFIEDGYVYYNNVNCDYENINTAISEFYTGAGELALKTGHIFKRSLDDTSKGICEIFAYTVSSEKHEKVREQTKLMCLKVTCSGLSQKEYAYKALFGYIQKEDCSIGDVYERYTMTDGKMNIDIICSTI
jgi:DNA-binding transcriptional MerR regulator